MLRPILTSTALAAAVGLSSVTIPAQAQGYPPYGSYLQSCGDPQVFGDSLFANCQRVDGSWDRTVLRGLSSCTGDIANANGDLTCGGEGYGSSYSRYEGYDRGPYGGYGYWGR
jgi:hypothetical protein